MRILRLACSTAPHTQDMAGPREIRAGHATAIPVRGGMLVRSEFGREDDDHDGGDGDNDYSYEDFRTEQYNHSETRTYDLFTTRRMRAGLGCLTSFEPRRRGAPSLRFMWLCEKNVVQGA